MRAPQPFFAPSGLEGEKKAAAIDMATCSKVRKAWKCELAHCRCKVGHVAQDIEFKHDEPAELRAIICALCERNMSERLCGVSVLMSHPYFTDFDWERLQLGLMEAPVLPSLNEVCD